VLICRMIMGVAARATISDGVGSCVERVEVGVSGLRRLVVAKVVKVDTGDYEIKILELPDDRFNGTGIGIPAGDIPLPALAGRETLPQPLRGTLYLCCGVQVLCMDDSSRHDV